MVPHSRSKDMMANFSSFQALVSLRKYFLPGWDLRPHVDNDTWWVMDCILFTYLQTQHFIIKSRFLKLNNYQNAYVSLCSSTRHEFCSISHTHPRKTRPPSCPLPGHTSSRNPTFCKMCTACLARPGRLIDPDSSLCGDCCDCGGGACGLEINPTLCSEMPNRGGWLIVLEILILPCVLNN